MLVYKLVRFFEPSSEAQYETTRATLTTFSAFAFIPDENVQSAQLDPSVAIVAFLLLLATFGIGLRCLNDFGKGLVSSKTYGQSYPICLWSSLQKSCCVSDRFNCWLPLQMHPSSGASAAQMPTQSRKRTAASLSRGYLSNDVTRLFCVSVAVPFPLWAVSAFSV